MEKQLLKGGRERDQTNRENPPTGTSACMKIVQGREDGEVGPSGSTSEAEAEEESFIAIIGLICHYEKLKCENLRQWKLKYKLK